MSEMTPESVKKQLKMVNRLGPLDSMRVVLLWETDRKRLKTAQARIEALEKKRDAWMDAALSQAKALKATRVLDDRDWGDMPVFVKAAQALDAALAKEKR
jgi:hypothetical protein